MRFIEELAARRRFGMRPGLDVIRAVCAALGNPQRRFKAVHVAGTNGKGAVCALLDAALRESRRMPDSRAVRENADDGKSSVETSTFRPLNSSAFQLCIGRYTSPHLMRLNERFFVDGKPISDEKLEFFAREVHDAAVPCGQASIDVTFFEALTAVAFLAFEDAGVDYAVLECGLGGRLDATNVCESAICVITRIGLDHCDWLGDTEERIAFEKAGIIKPGVPVVLGANSKSVSAVVAARALEVGAPFFYAPDLAAEAEIPSDFPLKGSFNRENAVTAMAALRVMERFGLLEGGVPDFALFAKAVWPGRFQRVGDFLVDGAHNPPAAAALAASLDAEFGGMRMPLVAGFCGDKDVETVLRMLAPHVSRGFAVRTQNPRSLSADETAVLMRRAGIPAEPCCSLAEALALSRAGTDPNDFGADPKVSPRVPSLVCGSLFLAGEALAVLGAYPWGDASRGDPSELLVAP